MQHTILVAEPWFTYISNGQKTTEVRLNSDKYKIIKPGDHIVFQTPMDPLSTQFRKIDRMVDSVHHYATFQQCLESEGISKCVPHCKTLEEGLQIYRGFYSKEKESQFGVVAWRLCEQ